MEVTRESSSALGQGCRLGFLGTLHMDVFRQRLEDEYDANVIITAPTVPYKGKLGLEDTSSTPLRRSPCALSVVYMERGGDRTEVVSNPTDFPDVTDTSNRVREIHEPIVNASIIVPQGQAVALR